MIKDVQSVKVIDAMIQSLLIAYFSYTLDGHSMYKVVIAALVIEQLLSVILHNFMTFKSKLKTQRFLYTVSILVFAAVYFYVSKNIKETYFAGALGSSKLDFPIHEVILMSVGLAICFWYNVVCFIEVKHINKRLSKKGARKR